MPTPVERFLRTEREGDSCRQLSASQEWDWQTNRFHGFVDRDQYLLRVRKELNRSLVGGNGSHILNRAHQTYTVYDVDGFSSEDRRRWTLLQGLRQALQSRRLRIAMLQEQQLCLPFQTLQREALKDAVTLCSANSPLSRARFYTQSSAQSLSDTFRLGNPEGSEKVFNLDLTASSHVYAPATRFRNSSSLLFQTADSLPPGEFDRTQSCPLHMNQDEEPQLSSSSQRPRSSRWNPIERWLRSLSHSSSKSSASYRQNSSSRTSSDSFPPMQWAAATRTSRLSTSASSASDSSTKSFFPDYKVQSYEGEQFFGSKLGSEGMPDQMQESMSATNQTETVANNLCRHRTRMETVHGGARRRVCPHYLDPRPSPYDEQSAVAPPLSESSMQTSSFCSPDSFTTTSNDASNLGNEYTRRPLQWQPPVNPNHWPAREPDTTDPAYRLRPALRYPALGEYLGNFGHPSHLANAPLPRNTQLSSPSCRYHRQTRLS